MGLFDSLKEIFSDAPEWKGARFEKYVLNLFNPKYYALVEKTPGFQNMDDDWFEERAMNPDFILRHRPSSNIFAIEAKYRSNLNSNNMLEWCKPQQLDRYKQFAME